nr:HypC/HybG/HupF family hydrogenase formation chaperone [Arthrospira sp. SH-MAG29]
MRIIVIQGITYMCLAVPGKLLSISGDDPLLKKGRVSFGGVIKEVSLAYVPEAQVGDYVLVHVGFALSRVEPEDALQTLADLQQMVKLG